MGGADEARDALTEGLALARTAWRDAWAPLAACTAGWGALFAAARADLPPDAATALAWTGLLLVLLMTPSKLGALHRLAARGAAPAPPGPAGLQLDGVEWRLTATAVALGALAVLLLAAWGVGAAALVAALRSLGAVAPALSGPGDAGLVLASPVLLGGLLAVLQAVGRLAVTLAADACEPGPRFARGWILTRGAGVAPALVMGAGVVAPLVGLSALAAAATGGPPSLPGTVLAGAGFAALTQFGLAPLNAGALAHLRRRGLERERAAAQGTVDTPGALGDKAGPVGPAAASAPPEILAA